MAHDIHLAERVRRIMARYDGVTERKKASSLTFMLSDKIGAWIKGGALIVRCAPAQTDALLRRPGITRFTMKGRETMKGWLLIDPDVADVEEWVNASVAFVHSLQ